MWRQLLPSCAALAVVGAIVGASTAGASNVDELHDALNAVTFLNSGVTRSTDAFLYEDIDAIGEGQVLIYLEAENVSCVHCVWSDGGKYYVPHPYLFRVNDTHQSAGLASAEKIVPFEDLPPLDWTQAPIVHDGDKNKQPSENACKAQCAAMSTCNVGLYLNGSVRHGECWLSTHLAEYARTDFCGKKPGQSCASFCKTGTKPTPGPAPPPPPPPPHPPGVYRGSSPASGMRSAVPLGGIGAGSFELRGDGSLHEFIIHNAGPGGAAKIQTYPDAFFAIVVDGESRVLSTHPPAGMQGVGSIRYSGTHPISRLQILDAVAPELEVELYGFSAFTVGNMPASGRPAAAFALSVSNTQRVARNVSFMLQLPLQIEEDQARPGTPLPGSPLTLTSASACLSACNRTKQCLSWMWTAGSSSCVLQSDAPLNRYSQGVTSGVAGTWGPANTQQCLQLTRPGLGPMHGDASLCASASTPNHKWSWAAESDARSAFSRLSHTNSVGADALTSTVALAAPHGAVSVSALVPAGANATLTITFGWNFPYRDMFNYDKDEEAFVPFGNVYAKHYADSTASAWGTIAPGGERESALASVVVQASAVSHALHGSLPEWLSDLLANSLSHTRDSMWWQRCQHCHNSSDSRVSPSSFGIWRQYEAYDCPDLGATQTAFVMSSHFHTTEISPASSACQTRMRCVFCRFHPQ